MAIKKNLIHTKIQQEIKSWTTVSSTNDGRILPQFQKLSSMTMFLYFLRTIVFVGSSFFGLPFCLFGVIAVDDSGRSAIMGVIYFLLNAEFGMAIKLIFLIFIFMSIGCILIFLSVLMYDKSVVINKKFTNSLYIFLLLTNLKIVPIHPEISSLIKSFMQ